MPQHSGYKTGVVRLLAHDIVLCNEFFPALEDRPFISIEREELLQTPHLGGRIGDGHAEPLNVGWSSADYPVLIDDLRDDARFVPPGAECVKSCVCAVVVRVRLLGEADEDVRIGKDSHQPLSP